MSAARRPLCCHGGGGGEGGGHTEGGMVHLQSGLMFGSETVVVGWYTLQTLEMVCLVQGSWEPLS